MVEKIRTLGTINQSMKLVRVVAPHFVAGFETDGVVRRAAPILKNLVGKSDDYAREVIDRYHWRASIVADSSGNLKSSSKKDS